MAPRLTIVLPLKGRPLFTLRFLWHANREKLPYHFIVADGQVDAKVAVLLENSSTHFPHLDLEYRRYPNDLGFGEYFQKMADALRRVRTPYVMLADNDDFLACAGLERSIDFLEANPDYVCCGGGIAGFAVYSRTKSSFGGVLGRLNRLSYRYMPYDRSADFDSPGVAERVAMGLRNSWSYYAVYRTPAMQTIWDEVTEMNLSDLQLHEKFCAMRTLTLGKARSDAATISYFRQYWTTLRSAFAKDWVHHLLRNRFSTDFANIIDRISDVASKADGTEKALVAERLRDAVEPWLRDFLRLNYGLSDLVRGWLRTRAPFVLTWLKTRRRYSVWRERSALFATLRKEGASEAYLKVFRTELDAVEDIVDGAEFSAFLRAQATSIIVEAAPVT